MSIISELSDTTGRTELVDRAYQRLYAQAYRVMKLYWAVRRPQTHGALVAIWHEGQILLVRQSYLTYYSLPGGYVKPGEDARQAAAREVREELHLDVDPEQLVPALAVKHEWNRHLDHVEIFELEARERPEVKIDNREVILAELFRPEVALTLDLFPPLRALIQRRLS